MIASVHIVCSVVTLYLIRAHDSNVKEYQWEYLKANAD